MIFPPQGQKWKIVKESPMPGIEFLGPAFKVAIQKMANVKSKMCISLKAAMRWEILVLGQNNAPSVCVLAPKAEVSTGMVCLSRGLTCKVQPKTLGTKKYINLKIISS